MLRPARMDYLDVGEPLFHIDFQYENELDPAIKQKIEQDHPGYLSQSAANQVAVIIPDISYVESMLIWAESSRTTSFAYTFNPYTSATDRPPVLKTGEETFNQTIRTKTENNKFKEQISEYSSQDPGFSSISNTIRYRDNIGRPPEATVRRVGWETSPSSQPPILSSYARTKYYLNSDYNNSVPPGGDVDYAYAQTESEAAIAAKTDLQIKEMMINQQNKTLCWYYPKFVPGDRVEVVGEGFKGAESRIVNVTWNLKFYGDVKTFQPLCQTDGTQVTLGLFRERSVKITQKTEDVPGGGGDINITTSAGQQLLGQMLYNTPHRRKFI